MDYFYTIEKSAEAEFKDRGSRFLGYVMPIQSIEAFKKELQTLKDLHPKAVHHCFAYRIGADGQTFRANDDGEPSGSAGRPILGQIDSKQLTNCAVVVVRYFGGTLLGVPGLINAYKTTATLALQMVPIIQKPIELGYQLHFDYTVMNEVMTIVKQFGCSVWKNEQTLFCELSIGIPKARLSEVLYKLSEMHTVDVVKLA